MGRKATATRDAVFKAAASIEIQTGNFKAVTIDAVRKRIGGGSSSTIHAHLQHWKTDHANDLHKRQSDDGSAFNLSPTIKSFIAKLRSDLDILERLLELEITSDQSGLANLKDIMLTPPTEIPKAVVKPKVSKKVSASKARVVQKTEGQPKSTDILENKDSMVQEEPDVIEKSEQSEADKPKQDIADIKDKKNTAQRRKKNKEEENARQGDLFS